MPLEAWTDDPNKPAQSWPYFPRRHVGDKPMVSVNGGPGMTWEQYHLERCQRRYLYQLAKHLRRNDAPPAIYPSKAEFKRGLPFPATCPESLVYLGYGPIPYFAAGIDRQQQVSCREQHRQRWFRNQARVNLKD